MMTRKKKNLISYVVFALVCVAIIIAGICYKNYSNEQKIKKAEKNAVTCVDDLTGKKIGVQIGTTGDIYASDYEGDNKGTVVERYNKGTDAIQALKDDKINCVILDEQPSLAYTEKNSELNGLNSAAYVAEVIRSGINSIDKGQFEAGRSLGLNYRQTMTSIVLPQAFKNALPALCNEFISLIKETSISGYIAIVDLTKAGDIIRSNTYDAFLPLITVAIIYLVIVIALTSVANALERRLRANERH